MLKESNQSLPIIIIGAGISGISCAKHLQDSKSEIIVLEARDRIGGRIHSIDFETEIFDLGASWIHGIQNNPIWEIVQKEQIKTVIFNYDVSVFLHENGTYFSDSEKKDFLHYISKIEKILKHSQGNTALDSVLLGLDSLEIKNKLLKNKIKQFFERIANDPFATDLSCLASNYQEYEGYFSGDEVIFPNGYAEVIQKIAEGIDIRCNISIKKIIQQEEYIEIFDDKGNSYVASKIVVTVPLGVLKAQDIQFVPPLSDQYKNAIHMMGFGSFNKVFFQLNEPLDFTQLYSSNTNYFFWSGGYCFNILDLSKIYKKPTYLILFGGKQSIFLDSSTDEDVWKFIKIHLQSYSCSLEHEPNKLLITRWGADIFSYGAFSFPALNHTSALTRILNNPIENRIFFSGEHCSLTYAGTVHGAYIHGKEVATRILESKNY